MKVFNLPIIAMAAFVLAACGTDGTGDEPVTTVPEASASTAPAAAPSASTSEAAAASAEPRKEVNAYGPHIDASAFLNALVESGCQIDKAEYKEVKRGGAIKIVCSKAQDPLTVDLDDL